ncbi:MAG TPA: hypothetical protein PKN96_00185 [Flavobacterium sp.]|uniref:hypothetical protein n=1 Tax=Flavobacterium sp. TaxID=239 RepID=UPI002BC46DAB|nr:hypothetical protein [Flavobacterium sp.]HNP31687.1 hypothetical protein [Flavobacterium sp.]
MRLLFYFTGILCFGTAFSQDICMKAELFDQSTNVNALIKNQNELDHSTLKPNALQINVFPNTYETFPEPWYKIRCGMDKGFKLIMTNTTTEPIEFWSSESIKWAPIREVYYNNKWIPLIPKVRVIQCGNEMHYKITLDPDAELVFLAPCLEGSYLTKYRFSIYNPIDKTQIYSNEFDGYFDTRLLSIKNN